MGLKFYGRVLGTQLQSGHGVCDHHACLRVVVSGLGRFTSVTWTCVETTCRTTALSHHGVLGW